MNNPCRERRPNRRQALARFANGFGMLGLAALLADEAKADATRPPDPRRPAGRPAADVPGAGEAGDLPVHVGRAVARRHVRPQAAAGAATTASRCRSRSPTWSGRRTGNLLQSPFKFAKHGQAGIEVSELLPNLAKRVDDLCVIRSMVADNINHNGACLQMNTGEQAFSRPSLGSWLTYGLGQREPRPARLRRHQPEPAGAGRAALVVELPAGRLPGDADLRPQGPDRQPQEPDLRPRPPAAASSTPCTQLNELHREGREDDSRLDARIESFELAFRMQAEAPEAFDVEPRVEGDAQTSTGSTTRPPRSSARSA